MNTREINRGDSGYVSPEILCLDICVEAGFAVSPDSTIGNYNGSDEQEDL